MTEKPEVFFELKHHFCNTFLKMHVFCFLFIGDHSYDATVYRNFVLSNFFMLAFSCTVSKYLDKGFDGHWFSYLFSVLFILKKKKKEKKVVQVKVVCFNISLVPYSIGSAERSYNSES